MAVLSAQSNFAEMVQLAKASGMKMIVLLNAVANSGHYAVQPGWNGAAGLASAVKLAHAQGILVGLHTMSASIPVQVRGKRALFEPFYTKTRTFAKTGSGPA